MSKTPEPRPWHVAEPESTGGWGLCVSSDGVIVAQMRGRPAQKRANADFIVRACNAHDVLLAACEAADCPCSVAERESGHRLGCWMPQMQEAVAKATD